MLAKRMLFLIAVLCFCSLSIAFQTDPRIGSRSPQAFPLAYDVRSRLEDDMTCSRNTRTSLSMSSVEQSSAVISIAKQFVLASSSVNALEDISPFLADDVLVSGPSTPRSIGKKAYLAEAGKELAALFRAMPDLQTSSYGYSADSKDPNIVWLKLRQRGTITGVFSFNEDVFPPNKKAVEFPVEMWSVRVAGGKVTEVTKGYVIDRTVGNTGGLSGPAGVLVALGEGPAKVSYLPIAVAIKQFFGRNRKSPNKKVSASPFPFAVMRSLAEQLLATQFGFQFPELLAEDFLFSDPFNGPLNKKEFLGTQGSLTSFLSEVATNSFNVHVDPFELDRVWLTTRCTGEGYVAAPEAVSVSFDATGLCYRITAGYVADRIQGNTKGLGGSLGFQAATASVSALDSVSFADIIVSIKESLSPASPPASVKAPAAVPSPPVAVPVAKQTAPPAEKAAARPSVAAVAGKPPAVPAKPAMAPAKPVVVAAKPVVVAAKPAVVAVKPAFVAGKPETVPPKSVIAPAKPAVAVKPAVIAAKPVVLPKPVVVAKPAVAPAKPAMAPAKPAAAGQQANSGKPIADKKVPDATKISPSSGNAAAAPKTLSDIIASKSSKGNAVTSIDGAIKKLTAGSISNEGFCREVIAAMGSMEAARDVLPDIIGSLPKGDKKSSLNQFFQEQL